MILVVGIVAAVVLSFAFGWVVCASFAKPQPVMLAPPPTKQQLRLMGLEVPGDERVMVTAREWNAMKLALWRSHVAWEIVQKQATEIVASAKHVIGCAGSTSNTEPCAQGCPDRETRMSALVILGAARQSAPAIVHKPADAPYFAPSREYFSEVTAALAVAEAELAVLRGKERTPPPVVNQQLKEAS